MGDKTGLVPFRAVNLFAPEAVAPGGRSRGLMPWRGAPSDARLTARVVHEDSIAGRT